MQRVYYSLISTYMGPALSYNSPAAALIPQEFTIASCFTAYCRAALDEILSIADITRPELVKVKRSSRKGRITRLKSKLEEARATPLNTLHRKTRTNLRDDLAKEIKIYDALQARYE